MVEDALLEVTRHADVEGAGMAGEDIDIVLLAAAHGLRMTGAAYYVCDGCHR